MNNNVQHNHLPIILQIFVPLSRNSDASQSQAVQHQLREVEENLADLQTHLKYLISKYHGRHEDVMALQVPSFQSKTFLSDDTPGVTVKQPPLNAEVELLLKNMTGMRAVTGLFTKPIREQHTHFVFQLMPHLMSGRYSLRPAYHLKSERTDLEYVLGVPTVKRYKEKYLIVSLAHLIMGFTDEDKNNTLIIVMVGETDLEYVLSVARQIELKFPKEIENGLIEIISPSSSYYPDLSSLRPSLGDSVARVKWRTKQNLDSLYLMTYAQSKGTFYLMLEDDVVTKNGYLQDIKDFTKSATVSNPDWFFIEFCHVGGIGKLFRSSDLIHFTTYIQLFYKSMPIDWLLESFLKDKICSADEDNAEQFGTIATYFPHQNPPVKRYYTTIDTAGKYTLRRAYEGEDFFWGVTPRRGDVIELWFEIPTYLKRYTFRSGNPEHVSDTLYNTVVEILGANETSFTKVGSVDEFGVAEADLNKEIGPITAIRLRVLKDSYFWVLISEIHLEQISIY